MRHMITPNARLMKQATPVVEQTLSDCEKYFKSRRMVLVNVSFSQDAFISKRMNGSSGWLEGSNFIHVAVNPRNKNWRHGVRASVAHEYNHVIRKQSIKNAEKTLLDQIVMDGLAQCFEEELTGRVSPHSRALSAQEAVEIWIKLKRVLSKPMSYELFKKIFFGGNKDFPVWAGYTVSYLVVKNRMEELCLTWQEVMKMDSKTLVGKGLN